MNVDDVVPELKTEIERHAMSLMTSPAFEDHTHPDHVKVFAMLDVLSTVYDLLHAHINLLDEVPSL